MELSFHKNTRDSVPDSDTTPQFQSENQKEKFQHSNRRSAEFQPVQQYPETFQNQHSGDKEYVNL